MKKIALVSLLGFAALSIGATYAGQSIATPQQARSHGATDTASPRPSAADIAARTAPGNKVSKPSDEQPKHRNAAAKKLPAGDLGVTLSSHPNEFTNRSKYSGSKNLKNSRRPESDNSHGAQNGLAESRAASNHPPNSVKAVSPEPSLVRHRGAYPAVVGGPGSCNFRSTTALNGTQMRTRARGH
jgi:hypothetical protein